MSPSLKSVNNKLNLILSCDESDRQEWHAVLPLLQKFNVWQTFKMCAVAVEYLLREIICIYDGFSRPGKNLNDSSLIM